MLSMLFFNCHPDKQGRQNGENECLYKTYNKLYHTDKQNKWNCNSGNENRF